MKLTIVVILLVLFASCKKKAPLPANRNNVFTATVIHLSGSAITINARGDDATMGCAFLGGGTYISGSNASKATVRLIVYATGFSCISAIGTYNFGCEYLPDPVSQPIKVYTNIGVVSPRSITFTTVTADFMEGNFSAVCKYLTDSVVVTGTFAGQRN